MTQCVSVQMGERESQMARYPGKLHQHAVVFFGQRPECYPLFSHYRHTYWSGGSITAQWLPKQRSHVCDKMVKVKALNHGLPVYGGVFNLGHDRNGQCERGWRDDVLSEASEPRLYWNLRPSGQHHWSLKDCDHDLRYHLGRPVP